VGVATGSTACAPRKLTLSLGGAYVPQGDKGGDVSGKNGGSNGHSSGSSGITLDLQQKRAAYVQQQLMNAQRPARLVGLFTARELPPRDLERLVDVCQQSLREEDPAATLTLAPVGEPSAAELATQRAWRITVLEGAKAEPHDCFVNVHATDEASSPHHGLIAHLTQLDQEMGRATKESIEPAKTYLQVASGRLDDQARIHPYQNLVALFATALNALIVDPAAAMVTMDPGEWAEAMEMSLELEQGMQVLRR
jgi:hypothetical protein